ncbi:uncharacterized protein LOC133530373 [Cydia pomonella]|uniref:uncharacterized protein LOC133530373 n=1 Tax=Cydia pomonella TaxID=82600 RepID=UPI002ADE8170|nr:uncharacterized protein LOC133530373 [Cydia pomonella]
MDTLASEMLYGKLKTADKTTHVLSIYRSPKTNKLRFVEEINCILKKIPPIDDVIVIGDMNLDLLSDNLNMIISKYKTMLCGHGLQSAIPDSEITRESVVDGSLQSSCIDHAWVRRRNAKRATAHMLTCKLSDHHMIGIRLDIFCVDDTRPTDVRYVLSNQRVINKLNLIDWSELLAIDCPLVLYEKICTVFSKIYNESFIKIKPTSKRENQPWVNKKLEKMINHRDELFRIWKHNPKNMGLRLDYTRYRNKVNKVIDFAKNKFRQNEIQKCEGDFRKIWGNINNWLGRTTGNVDSTIMKYLGKTDNLENICNKFSNTFTQEILDIKHTCTQKFLSRNSYVIKCDVSFRFRKVCPSDVEKIIDKLSNGKAPGIDGIRVQDIKCIKKDFSIILAKFVNLCLSKCLYPNLLKKSLIRPIFKQGSHTNYSNYRPIAILSVINKIVEKIVVGQVSNFLEGNDILSPSQHGFRRGRSTATALTQFSNYVNSSLGGGQQVLAVFIDFRKAFDTLDHEQLLQAMDECGIRGPTNQWFREYLHNRTLRTVVKGTTGAEACVSLGVPTGSVYGPVGYVMHVNSVSNVVQHCKVYMYADDMCLVLAGGDLSDMVTKVQDDFENITKWAHDNGIILNINKTKCMRIFSPYNKKANQITSNDISIIGHTYECLHWNKNNCTCSKIELVDSFRYLGLLIDTHFNWKLHINQGSEPVFCKNIEITIYFGLFYTLNVGLSCVFR